ncbi:MAG: hypothetical protein LBC18_08940, partial [Opitutaceae bacterium]|nr:hypothetical protein [Opitutaceae bacterium]
MKAKLRASTTIPALLAVAAAITGATAFLAPAPARAADEVALPLPSIRWDPVESGTSVPNTGSRDGLPDATSAYALLLKKFTGANFNATPGVDLV